MGVRYLGNKSRVADAIVDLAGAPARGRFIDVFAGTGSVASVAAERGWAVTVNDALPSAVAMSVGAVVGARNLQYEALGGYCAAVAGLDAAPSRPGFIHAEYSPASIQHAGIERRYFTEHNAARLDGMRRQVSEWSAAGLIGWAEEQLLLADLMRAANSVANISGTYGCFLKGWTQTALRPIAVTPRQLPDRASDFHAVVGDAFDLTTTIHDTVYLDPPYTKRQYSAYYHLLETLHAGDGPDVDGVTGLRPWRHKASDFCYKARALDALTRLVLETPARQTLLSYSNEGHIPMDRLVSALTDAGQVAVHELKPIGRYRPNARASEAGGVVHEFVVEITPIGVHDDARNEDQAVRA